MKRLAAAGEAALWPDFRIKRAYNAAAADGGARVIVDRVLPRRFAKGLAPLKGAGAPDRKENPC